MDKKPKKRVILSVGDQLKKMRKDAGFTQKQMAERLEIAPRTWRDYEKDVSDIGTRKLIKASSLCRVNPMRLFESFFMIWTPVTQGLQPKKMMMTMKEMKNNRFIKMSLPRYHHLIKNLY
jgi:DNA-binding XRE family transcriptional regulator